MDEEHLININPELNYPLNEIDDWDGYEERVEI